MMTKSQQRRGARIVLMTLVAFVVITLGAVAIGAMAANVSRESSHMLGADQ